MIKQKIPTYPEKVLRIEDYNKLYNENEELKARIGMLEDALKPLANLDLKGVNGLVVYQRNDSFIMTSDVIKANNILDPF